MRVLGIDLGRRRIGLAISDASATLARPLKTIARASDADTVRQIRATMAALDEEEGIDAVVVGLPTRLDGSPSDQTGHVERMIARLRRELDVPVYAQDERLSSREAESRLALGEKDWRKRKLKLDAAAAAVILQDYLDAHVSSPGTGQEGITDT